jgi:hypothetical protein
MEVSRGIREPPLIRHVQRSVNIRPMMQKINDVEQRNLRSYVFRPHSLG